MAEKIIATDTDLLTLEQKEALLAPIDEEIAKYQKQIDALRVDGTNQVQTLNDEITSFKKNKELDDESRNNLIEKDKMLLVAAKRVEAENKDKVNELIKQAEAYLKENYKSKYLDVITADCGKQKVLAKSNYDAQVNEINQKHTQEIAKIQSEINAATDEAAKKEAEANLKNENYIHKNQLYDAKVVFQNKLQAIKDERHEAFLHEYHLIDLLRNSKFTLGQIIKQRSENYAYNFKLSAFLLKNGLYIVIIAVFIGFCIMAPITQGISLLTMTNILQILENSSSRVFLALGVAGLILLGGTDLSIGRMVGLSTTITAIFWHEGNNAIHIFGGPTLNFDAWPDFVRIIVPFLLCIILCAMFSCIAGFFTAKFKMHPFISTMANMLIIFGLWFYATAGTNSGGVKASIVNKVTPKIGGVFPTIIFWAIICVFVIWFIWNKTKIGKDMYAVGGNAEAAAVSGISVFWVTMFAFMLAGILYGIGGFLECSRVRGSASASYGSGWETDAIAACVVGGISFSGGIGKISGAVFGVVIFTGLTYGLSFLNIDTNIQYIIKGIIILAAVTLDSLKYLKKK